MAGFFQKLFGQKTTESKRVSQENAEPEALEASQPEADLKAPRSARLPVDTEPLKPAPAPEPVSTSEPDLDLPEPCEPAMEFPQAVVGCAQSVGRQRDHNEDALLTFNSTLAGNPESQHFGLYIVADGMGGHLNGEVASLIAVRSFASSVLDRLIHPLFNPEPHSPEASLLEILDQAAQEANRLVSRNAPGGGTTITAALLLGEQLTIAHVGDSRAYLIQPGGEIKALTRDHSLVNRLVEIGQISADEAAIHPQRNVLYRALGQADPLEAELITAAAPAGAHLLICSDGLWGVVPEAEIAELVLQSGTPAAAAQVLVDAANLAGGPDNITAIVVRLPG